MGRAYRHLGFGFGALAGITVLGFYKPYLALFPRFDPSFTALVHIHAAALFGWVALLVVQSFLATRGRLTLHRQLGKGGYFLMPVIIGTSVGMILKQYHESLADKLTPAESVRTLHIPVAELSLLTLFYVLAMAYRRQAGRHTRFIICNAAVLITPALARVAGYWFSVPQVWSYTLSFLVTDALLGGLIFFDRRRQAAAGPYVWALGLFLVLETAWAAEGCPF